MVGDHFKLDGGKRNRDAYISGREKVQMQDKDAWHLSTKSLEVEELVTALATMTGESKTEAVRRSLVERHERLSLQSTSRRRGTDFLRYLEEEVWPKAPPDQLGRRLSRDEEADILGYGPEGV
jgi:antitoxin VapB